MNIVCFSISHAETFENFCNRLNKISSISELTKIKNKEYQLYLSSKNKTHLYNSKYIRYCINKKNGNINQAITDLNSIIVDYDLKNTEQLTWINYFMAKTLTDIDALKVAHQYEMQALRLAQKDHHPNIIELIYSDIGLNLYKQKKYSEGAEYFKKAYYLSKVNPKKKYFSLFALNDIGVCYRKLNNNLQALNYYTKSQTILLNTKKRTFEEETLLHLLDGNIGSILGDLGEYDKAIKRLDNEFNFYKVHTQFLDIGAARTLIDLIEIFEAKKDKVNANKRIVELKKIENEKKDAETSILIDQFLYEYYLRNGEPDKSITISNRLLRNTQLSKEKTIQKLSFLSDLVYEQKITQLKDNTRTNAILLKHAIKEKKFSQLVAYISIFFFLFVVFVGYLFYRSMKKNMIKNEIIAKQNLQIVESINYSKRIQDALLPNISEMNKIFHNIFIFYQPKDIVSGDFYWHKDFGTHSILACVDCTGHGVPGGFMSTIGSLAMDKITDHESLSPSEILFKLNNEIIRILRQQNDGEIQDGMDLSICIINHEKKQISFSGARNGIIIVSNNNAKRYKADLLPVGGNYSKKGKPIERVFTTQTIDISENDWVYMYTDGFIEQIGGTTNLPMNYHQYETLLIQLAQIDTNQRKKETLHAELEKWRGLNKQTDDVLIMGFQIT